MYSGDFQSRAAKQDHPLILVIDDDPHIRLLLRRILERICPVLCAENVNAGLDLVKKKHPSLVIIDFDIPGKNGIEGAREIRAVNPNISIIMLSGSTTRELIKKAREEGINECLCKPCNIQTLRGTVERFLQPCEAAC